MPLFMVEPIDSKDRDAYAHSKDVFAGMQVSLRVSKDIFDEY